MIYKIHKWLKEPMFLNTYDILKFVIITLVFVTITFLLIGCDKKIELSELPKFVDTKQVITKEQVVIKIKSRLPKATIETYDGNYKVLDHEFLEQAVKWNKWTNFRFGIDYEKEVFDCDDFAKVLAADIYRMAAASNVDIDAGLTISGVTTDCFISCFL